MPDAATNGVEPIRILLEEDNTGDVYLLEKTRPLTHAAAGLRPSDRHETCRDPAQAIVNL
jgi:hypothetical protein